MDEINKTHLKNRSSNSNNKTYLKNRRYVIKAAAKKGPPEVIYHSLPRLCDICTQYNLFLFASKYILMQTKGIYHTRRG